MKIKRKNRKTAKKAKKKRKNANVRNFTNNRTQPGYLILKSQIFWSNRPQQSCQEMTTLGCQIHKEELGDQYKVVFSQFVTDFPYIKGPGGTVCVWGGGVLIPLSYKAKMTLHCLQFLHAGTYILDFEAHQRNFPP